MAASSPKVYELFVNKIPWTLASREMKEYFSQFGVVKKCVVPFHKDTGFHKGFCWVTYVTEEGVNNALQKDPHILEGAKLHVQKNSRPFIGKKPNDVDESN